MRLRSRDAGGASTTTERTGASPGLVRGLVTLAGVVGAAALIWAAQLFDLDSSDGFWAGMVLLAAAGFALGISQLLGGWTKWGWPTLSPTVLLVGFLPTFVLGAWLLLAWQPESGWQQNRFDDWANDLGLGSLVADFGTFLPVVPVVIGLVLAFSFDTTGPRRRVIDPQAVARENEETVAAELRREREQEPAEPLTDESGESGHTAA